MSKRRRLTLVRRIFWLWLRRQLVIVDVRGTSMLPAVRPGDRLFFAIRARPYLGAIVLRKAPPPATDRHHVKRVIALAGAVRDGKSIPLGYCWLEGDGSGSADSRQLGPIALTELTGIAVARLSQDGLNAYETGRTG